MSRLVLSAGEDSGDRLGAELVAALTQELPELEVRGLVGPRLRAAGVEEIGRAEDIAVMGIAEVLRHAATVRRAWRAMHATLEEGADLLVVIDAPDFNIPLARKARALGIPVVFYVSPQVWAWRAGRAREIAALAEEVLCLFPFEPALYQAVGGRASFVGHPVAERLQPAGQGTDWAVLPGSRRSELRRLLPAMAQACQLLRARVPDAVIRLPVAPGLSRELLLSHAPAGSLDGVELVGSVEEAVRPARAALVTSGTATLEVGCLGVPLVAVYRVHPLTYWIGRILVRGVKHFAMPNLVLEGPVVPEILQVFTPEDLVEAWLAAAEDNRQRQALTGLSAALGGPGAIDRAAQAVLRILSRARP